MKYFLLLLSIFTLAACNQSDGTTKSNYPYKFLIDQEGEKPQVGDLVIFHEKVYLNEEEIFSTEKYGQKEIILPEESALTRPLPPNYEILFEMSPGDSVSITQSLKDLKDLPKGYSTKDELTYVVKLVSITPKSELTTRKKKARTSSNYPYEIIQSNGNILAQAGDRVRFREYRYLNDSLIYTTPMEKPMQAFLPARAEIPTPPPGNYEALLMAGIGDSLHLDQLLENVASLPKQLNKNDTIKYRIQILDILTPGEYVGETKIAEAAAAAEMEITKAKKSGIVKMVKGQIKQYNNGELEDELTHTHSGLKYMVHKKGDGKIPSPMQDVSVHYAGFLLDGTVFDNSYDTGEALKFPLGMGRVIKGWDEGISKLTVGSKATLFVPYALAYGEAGRPGTIPRRSDLVFYVEVLDVER